MTTVTTAEKRAILRGLLALQAELVDEIRHHAARRVGAAFDGRQDDREQAACAMAEARRDKAAAATLRRRLAREWDM